MYRTVRSGYELNKSWDDCPKYHQRPLSYCMHHFKLPIEMSNGATRMIIMSTHASSNVPDGISLNINLTKARKSLSRGDDNTHPKDLVL